MKTLIDENVTIEIKAFQYDFRPIQEAMDQLRRSAHQLGKLAQAVVAAAKAFSPPIRILVDNDQYKRLKLPRKKKKAFIRKNGRAEYYRRYHQPNIALEINSPGGMV